MNILDDKVLLLNRLMQPLRLISVRKAFFLLTKPRRKDPSMKVATVLDVDENHEIVGPVRWEDWLQRPVQENERSVATSKQRIRVPSVIVLADYDRVPIIDPQLTKSNMWVKQKGRCMYTLEAMRWEDCDMDHFIPQSKGGKTDWSNCGLTKIEYNRRKGDKAAKEVGLELKIPLGPPKAKPLAAQLRRDERFPEWDYFIRA